MRKPEKVDTKPQEYERKSTFGSIKGVSNSWTRLKLF